MSYDKASSGIKPTTREPRIAIRIGVQRCSHCGAPIVPPGLALTPVQRRIVAVVQRRGEVSAEDLRAAVWADDADGGPENLKTLHVHIYLLNKKLRRDRQTVARIVNTVRAIEAATKQKAVLIIVDTVSRALAGGDENSSKDMGELITTIGGIQQNTSAAALLLHHVPHEGDRMRGHGNLLGAVDTTVHVVKGIVFRTATVIKANDSNEGEQVGFTLESIELPGGAQAPVVVPVEVGSTRAQGAPQAARSTQTRNGFWTSCASPSWKHRPISRTPTSPRSGCKQSPATI
jgi:hypothetical protein